MRIEQLALFVPGLLMLAIYCPDGDYPDGDSMRSAVVWIVARGAFWVGYHYGSGGMVQSLIVLLYVSSRFGFDIAGPVGVVVPLVLFAGIEVWLVFATWHNACVFRPTCSCKMRIRNSPAIQHLAFIF
jgi:hypothetical protein